MISFSLKCANDHQFDSWFQSSSAFDKLKSAGMVTCAVCGSDDVTKALMAPRVAVSEAQAPTPLSQPASPAEQAIKAMREHIETNSEDVGTSFASEARAMHEGIAPERSIYGEAKLEDAKKLIEDGVPVAPLPFKPNRKTN